jgi:hypothetical protein
MSTNPSPPSIDDVPMIVRREIEARILAPFVEALSEQFGRRNVVDILRATIVRIARQSGREMALRCEGADLAEFQKVVGRWREGGALELTVLHHDRKRYEFNVTRCLYAEMYRRLGIPELGELLSCNRDFSASEGFNPNLKLQRTQTLMDGASHCDFRYRLDADEAQ